MKKLIIVPLALVLLLSIAAAEQLSFDGFESGSFCGGSGWSDSCWTTAGSTAIQGWSNPYEGNRHVWLRSNTGVLSRTINISGMSDISVSFAVRVNSLEGGDTAVFDVSVDGGAFTTIKSWSAADSTNVWNFVTYSIPVTGSSMVVRFRSLMSDLGDEMHYDNIQVSGVVGIPSEINVFMEKNYPVGAANVPILITSTETNALHTIRLSASNGSVFCEKNVISPSVAMTSFFVYCDMPTTPLVDATAFVFATNTPTINTTSYFNVVNYAINPDMLKIQQVYYPVMTLQGSTIELFALVQNYTPISTAKVLLTYPDKTTRLLSMYPTINNGEYRALITDTYRTGSTDFTMMITAQDYSSHYTNSYYVQPYNPATMKVWGTEYAPYDDGKVFLQLIDNNGQAITTASCQLDIYYPDNTLWYDNFLLSSLNDGIFFTEFVVPNIEGVYILSVKCYYDDIYASFIPTSLSYNGDLYEGSTGSLVEVTDADCVFLKTQNSRQHEFTFSSQDLLNINVSEVTMISVNWLGQHEENANLQLWNYNTNIWNTIGASFVKTTIGACEDTQGVTRSQTTNIGNYINNGEIRARIYLTANNKKIHTDTMSVVVHNQGSFVSTLRGAGEIHVSRSFNNITDYLQKILNNTNNISVGNVTIDLTEITDYLVGINTSTTDTLSLLQFVNATINISAVDIPVIMIGGTEYAPGDEGLVATRLSRVQGNNQVLVTGATCNTTILYPNASVFATAAMTEYGSGIYYYNFSVPSVNGVYIYAIDCSAAGRDYYGMNTFHVSTPYNYSADYAALLSYLQDINTTITTIDGRIIDLATNITALDAKIVLLNGTITDVYSLLTTMNSTITTILSVVNSLNATLVSINGSLLSINNVIIDINGSLFMINQNLMDLNVTSQTILSYVQNLTISNDAIYQGIISLQNDSLSITNSLLAINSTITGIDSKLLFMNLTLYDILAQGVATNQSLTTLYDIVLEINATQYNYSTELADIYSLLLVVNSTQYDYSSELADLYSLLLVVNATQYDYSSELADIYSLLLSVNATQYNYSGELADIYSLLLSVNATQYNYSSELADIYSLLQEVNATQYNYSTELADIYSLLITINASQYNYSAELADIYSLLFVVNATQYDYSIELADIYSLLLSVNATQYNYSTELSELYSLLLVVNATQYDYSSELATITAYVMDINATQYNYSTELLDIYLLLQAVNSTQYNYSTELATILSAVQVINYSSELAELYSLLLSVNATQYNYSTELSALLSAVQAINYSVELADLYSLLLAVNATQYNYSSELADLYALLLLVNGSQYNYSTELTAILAAIISTNVTSEVADIYSLLLSVNATQYNYSAELAELLLFAQAINASQYNYSAELAELLLFAQAINATQYNYSSELVALLASSQNITLTLNGINTSIGDVLVLLDDLSMNVTELLSYSIVMNTTLADTLTIVQSINATLPDIIVLQQAINGSVGDLLTITTAMNITLSEGIALLLSLNLSVADVYALTTTIANTTYAINATLYDMVLLQLVMNQSLSSLLNTTITINDNVLTIIGDIQGYGSVVLTINSSVTAITSQLALLTQDVAFINASIAQILNTTLVINASVSDSALLLASLTNTTSSHTLLLLNLTASCGSLNTTIADLSLLVQNLSAVQLAINESIWYFGNITTENNQLLLLATDQLNDTITLLVALNMSSVDYLPELLLIQQALAQQYSYLRIALADVSFFNTSIVNASDYYTNHYLTNPSILATQALGFSLTILQPPLEGADYRVYYYVYNQDTGELVKEDVKQLTGVGAKNIVVSSLGLEPVAKASQKYVVVSRVAMLNGDGLWQSFPIESLGILEVFALTRSPVRFTDSQYSAKIVTDYSTYSGGDTIGASLLITNPTATTTDDALLSYWLEDASGNRVVVGEETISGLSPGTTTLKKSLLLPANATTGEWRVGLQYETITQPAVIISETLSVTPLRWWEKLNQRLPLIIYRNAFWFSLGLGVLLALFLLILYSFQRQHKKKFIKQQVTNQ